MRAIWLRVSVPSCLLLLGCVEQTMTIDSDPPGALVYLNDQEVGRTPLRTDFTWYGDYDVQLRLEGYETLKTHKQVAAPIWNWVPFDLVANLLPITLRDHQEMTFTLKPLDPSKDQPAGLMSRAGEMRDRLESSQYTRKPATRPTTTTAPSTTRITSP